MPSDTSHDSARRLKLMWLTLALIAVACLAGVGLGVYWTEITEFIRANLGPPLKRWHAPLDSFLSGLPMWTAQACAIGLFGLALLFAWLTPRRFIYLGAPDQARWRDLRIWATLVLIPYMLIYLMLGL